MLDNGSHWHYVLSSSSSSESSEPSERALVHPPSLVTLMGFLHLDDGRSLPRTAGMSFKFLRHHGTDLTDLVTGSQIWPRWAP
jgi:hypothetical protein